MHGRTRLRTEAYPLKGVPTPLRLANLSEPTRDANVFNAAIGSAFPGSRKPHASSQVSIDAGWSYALPFRFQYFRF